LRILAIGKDTEAIQTSNATGEEAVTRDWAVILDSSRSFTIIIKEKSNNENYQCGLYLGSFSRAV